MILVLLYGPPAVGKLTVAKALQKITGFKLLHNHLIVNVVGSIVGFGNLTARRLNTKIRLMLYQAALQQNLKGLITTFVYYGDFMSNISVINVIKVVRSHKGKVLCVKLSCDRKVLERRLTDRSRRSTHKLTSLRKLRKVMKMEIVDSIIPENIIHSVSIDNTNLSPKETALIIKRNLDKLSR